MKYIIISLIVFCGLCSCKRSDYNKLATINALIEANDLDSAETEIAKIRYSGIDNNNDVAYYNLLRCKLDYKTYMPYESDTLINFCIKQFSESKIDSLLAESYYYKGAQNYENGMVKEGVRYLKKAENTSHNVTNISLKHKIIEKLAEVNINEGEYNLALEYCEKNKNLSALMNNKEYMAYAYLLYFDAYKGLKKEKQANECLAKIEPYIKYIDPEKKSDFYSSISLFYINQDLDIAEKYLNEACKYGKNEYYYHAKGSFYSSKGVLTEAIACFDSAYQISNVLSNKGLYLKTQASILEKSGDYKKVIEINKKIFSIKDSIFKVRQLNNIRNIQAQNDFELKELKFKQWVFYSIMTIAILFLIIIGIYLYSKVRSNKDKAQVLENRLLIDIYSKKIEKMKETTNIHNTEVRELQNKIDDLNQKQSKILFEGKKLYESIQSGGTCIRWDKNDFLHFIEYYKLIDLPFVVSLETNYGNLSPRYKFFEILYNMDKKDEDIERILGISHSTIKSTRSRIKSKKLE